jgi:hypothetical protein
LVSLGPLLIALLVKLLNRAAPSPPWPVDELIRVIPVSSWPAGGFVMFPPSFITVLATVVSFFVIAITLARRPRFFRSSTLCLVGGIMCVVVYFGLTHFVVNDLYWKCGWVRDDPRRLLGDLVLLVAYCGGFAFITRASALLRCPPVRHR